MHIYAMKDEKTRKKSIFLIEVMIRLCYTYSLKM